MLIRLPNRYERSGLAFALAMPCWWVFLAVALLGPMVNLTEFFVAAGKRMLTGGKRVLKAGKRRIANGTNNTCCCCEACSNCSDSVPSAYIVTVTGTEPCTGCLACAGGLGTNISFKNASESNVDGTYTVPCIVTGFGCVWSSEETYTGMGTFEAYSGTTCAGSPVTSSLVRVSVTKFGTDIQVALDSSSQISFFSGSMTVGTTCADGAGYSGISNDNVDCAPPTNLCRDLTINGTADVDPV